MEHRICHCGKCQIKCYKHGKIAACAECKKRRKLGTIVEKGKMRHICNECCTRLAKAQEEKQNKLIMEQLRAGE